MGFPYLKAVLITSSNPAFCKLAMAAPAAPTPGKMIRSAFKISWWSEVILFTTFSLFKARATLVRFPAS
jgi:hypothetical protein